MSQEQWRVDVITKRSSSASRRTWRQKKPIDLICSTWQINFYNDGQSSWELVLWPDGNVVALTCCLTSGIPLVFMGVVALFHWHSDQSVMYVLVMENACGQISYKGTVCRFFEKYYGVSYLWEIRFCMLFVCENYARENDGYSFRLVGLFVFPWYFLVILLTLNLKGYITVTSQP